MNKKFPLWEKTRDFTTLIRAFYRASRGKFDRYSVLKFYQNLEENCLQIQSEIDAGQYPWGKYRRFMVEDPKRRVIESAPFRDRVVHHALHEALEPIFEPTFIAESYACRKGLGNHLAVKRLRGIIKQNPNLYFLQLDVRRYFPSIERGILYDRIKLKVHEPPLLSLLRSLIDGGPGSLGIPIGNLTSQLFANVYLSPLDHFIKRNLKVKHYLRYMDDLVVLDHDLKKLRIWKDKIQEFTKEKLKLSFHPHKVHLGKVSSGISFLGYRTFPWGVYLRGKSLRRFYRKMHETITLDKKVKRLLSYEGHFCHSEGSAHLKMRCRQIALESEGMHQEYRYLEKLEGLQ